MLAQVPVEQSGMWMALGVGSLIGLLTVGWLSRQLWVSFSEKKSGARLVTEEDLRRRMRGLKMNLTRQIDQVQERVEARLDVIVAAQDDARAKLKTMEEDTRKRFHDLNGVMQPIVTNMAVMTQRQETLGAALAELTHENKAQTQLLTEIRARQQPAQQVKGEVG